MYSLVLPNGASKEPCTWCLPASGAFHGEKKESDFLATSVWLLDLIRGLKKTTFYIFANWKKQVETPPSRWFHRCVLGRTIPAPQSSLLTDSRSISLSYSRTFAFPFAESIIIQLSPASLSASLITHDKSVHASIYRGLRGRNSPSWGFLEARCHHGAFPPSGSGGIISVLWPSSGWAACNLSHTLKNIPINRRQI